MSITVKFKVPQLPTFYVSRHCRRHLAVLVLFGCSNLVLAFDGPVVTQTNLVASHVHYNPQILDPSLVNAWGIAIRPAGAGGHFWVTANGAGSSNQFVGDVGGRPIFQDSLAYVTTPGPLGVQGTPTGVVFNPSSQFVITQVPAIGSVNNAPITAAAKFLFATDNGVISAWTERKNSASASGFDWPLVATTVIDDSARGSQFFGIAASKTGRLYAADFGVTPRLRVWNGAFEEQTAFAYPFADSQGTQPGDWVPFNVQVLERNGAESVWVTYAKSKADEQDMNKIYPGEEDAGIGNGRIAEFRPDGTLIRSCDGSGLFNAPWGVAITPESWGAAANELLVSNFGDGTIARVSLNNCSGIDFLRTFSGDAISIEGIWGLQFGNGASLGELDRLYFAAGPEDETEGVFGYLATAAVPLPSSFFLLVVGLISLFIRRLK
jgi:uncharacterized protein (TIGR03118 family)